ncbi:hypothetical protein [Leisingera methylohalidivorans]|uniref:Uncharacterized protein n=1 Tax=Leisingera methylohalidivorans DSM 14336 TaxID=999552 RepID=V9VR81_9RHOB|nr:hypothetical protein [Leisingera methylohalidivorans]AHD00219.1 hypothetical protein METH_05305 [Leisingera methylohalidivorans DSM 14336]
MKHFPRLYLGLFLALAVALTAHSAAARQGARDAAGQMVICTGLGPEIVYVDSDGQPVPPPHSCPECVMHLLDAVALPAALPVPGQSAGRVDAVPQKPARGGHREPEATARSPPAA